MDTKKIEVNAEINAPISKVWEYYTTPKHIMNWNSASDDWHTPSAINDLRVGGRFVSRMEAKDGSAGFDFGGEYTAVVDERLLEYRMDDQREVSVEFDGHDDHTHVVVNFDPENENPHEMQQQGWQSILDNFKKYVENN